MRVKTGMAE